MHFSCKIDLYQTKIRIVEKYGIKLWIAVEQMGGIRPMMIAMGIEPTKRAYIYYVDCHA